MPRAPLEVVDARGERELVSDLVPVPVSVPVTDVESNGGENEEDGVDVDVDEVDVVKPTGAGDEGGVVVDVGDGELGGGIEVDNIPTVMVERIGPGPPDKLDEGSCPVDGADARGVSKEPDIWSRLKKGEKPAYDVLSVCLYVVEIMLI